MQRRAVPRIPRAPSPVTFNQLCNQTRFVLVDPTSGEFEQVRQLLAMPQYRNQRLRVRREIITFNQVGISCVAMRRIQLQ